uniref:hypothetical protein n=1 Tax=Stenotrophomonas cyclobalanopsidis TaxID=2771362 RepID=UPI002FDA7438
MSIASPRPPDQGRLTYLQQLARRGDRRLLLGSAVMALLGLGLAVGSQGGLAAALAATAMLP